MLEILLSTLSIFLTKTTQQLLKISITINIILNVRKLKELTKLTRGYKVTLR